MGYRVAVVGGNISRSPGPLVVDVTAIGAVRRRRILTRSGALLVYWVVFFVCASLFVRGYEEPYLRRQFGASYERYTHEVGRWIPRLRPASKAR